MVIFLVGFMGCGKTTLGQAVCRSGEWVFADLDTIIESTHGMSVSEIFSIKGEEWFRHEESRQLRKLATETPEGSILVVGCGGGTPCHSGNMEWMNAHGLTVRLQARSGRLLRRLVEGATTRPLLKGKTPEEIRAIMEERMRSREPYYGLARLHFDSSFLENEEEIASSVEQFRTLVHPYLQNYTPQA